MKEYILDKEKFMSAPLNDGTQFCDINRGVPCFCAFGAFLKALHHKAKPSVDERLTYIEYAKIIFKQLTGINGCPEIGCESDNYSILLHIERDISLPPIYKALKRFEHQLLFTNPHLKVDPSWQMAFKTKMMEQLEALGVKFVSSRPAKEVEKEVCKVS